MAAIHDMTIPLLPQRYYHIYNRGIDRNPIFFIDENYRYFLKKYAEKTEGYFNTFAYCLMENHFHFFIQPLSNKEILTKGASDYLFVNQRFLKDFVIPWTARVGIDSSSVKQEEDLLTNFENWLHVIF
jgi:REP element-mobilizing transposase RayT